MPKRKLLQRQRLFPSLCSHSVLGSRSRSDQRGEKVSQYISSLDILIAIAESRELGGSNRRRTHEPVLPLHDRTRGL
jgi:hypothetical protein